MKGNTPNEYIIDFQTGLLEGVASELPIGIGSVSLWRDGYWTAGKYLSVGSDIYGWAITDIVIPWFGGNINGTTMFNNKLILDNLGDIEDQLISVLYQFCHYPIVYHHYKYFLFNPIL